MKKMKFRKKEQPYDTRNQDITQKKHDRRVECGRCGNTVFPEEEYYGTFPNTQVHERDRQKRFDEHSRRACSHRIFPFHTGKGIDKKKKLKKYDELKDH